MTYLMNVLKKKSAAHVVVGNDTACRLWSTGGISPSRAGWEQKQTVMGRRVCFMCFVNLSKQAAA